MSLFLTVGDLVGAALFVVALAVVVFLHAQRWNAQRKCQHEFFCETQACEAICIQCGKNLGFIGNVRNRGASGGADHG